MLNFFPSGFIFGNYPLYIFIELVFMLLQIQHECKLEVNVDEYVEAAVRPYLMDVIYCWSKVDLFLHC